MTSPTSPARRATDTDKLLVEISGKIALVTINNPQKRNALSREIREALPGVLAALDADPDVRVIVVTGAGDKAFASGADISEFAALRTTPEARAEYDRSQAALTAAWASVGKPVIAMIRGFCMGGGLLTALQADIRIAAEDSQFGIPAARLGLGYGFSSVTALLSLVTPAQAAEILFSARRFPAAEAWQMGLVNRVVSPDDLREEVMSLAADIAANAPLTVAAAKAAIREAASPPQTHDLARVEAMIEACFRSEDYQEGQRAFAEKRSPVFSGGEADGIAPPANPVAVGPAGRLTAGRTEEVRTRVRLMIQITARAGKYRKGLLAAAARLSPEEAAIISDLERHGLQVPQLHDVLCGGHVLVDDPQLYEDWRFTKVSHPRISSHHRDIDKTKYPDIGMRGAVVREKLHGRTAQGTWVQLEKTPAAFGSRKLPSMDDIRHLIDYVVYRVTRSNVGPWGLSGLTERHPMYLSPAVATSASLSPPVAESLAAALRRIEADDDVTSTSDDLARRFPPPERANLADELGRSLSGRAGRGLFGGSEVWVTETLSPLAASVLSQRSAPALAERDE